MPVLRVAAAFGRRPRSPEEAPEELPEEEGRTTGLLRL